MKTESEYGLFKLFSNYFWLGIVLILLSIIISLNFNEIPFWVSICMRLLEAVGVAVLVASIFTYASGTSEFIDKIKLLLQDIVINRNFLGNIDSTSKREALSSLIKPSIEEKLLYSNIEGYLNTYIAQTMDVTSKCVRSNYSVNARAYIEDGKVYVDSKISYRLYPTKDGYSDIRVGFLAGEESSACRRVIVNPQSGERAEIKDLEYKEITIDAGKARLATIDLSSYAKNCSHLDIEIDMKECGYDHWMMLSFAALIPTDKFRHMLRCEDGLVIRAHHTFIHGAKFHIDQPSDIEINISCNEWVNEGTGLSILISFPHEVNVTSKCS